MAVSMKSGVLFSGSSETKSFDLTQQMGFSSTSNFIQSAKTQSLGQRHKSTKRIAASYCISRGMRWWEKTMKPNIVEIKSAQELVDSLKDAGNKLVVIDFYSPSCGACRALHPKICELAESNPEAIFLKINYEDLKKMCYALHIHVLPFFRFYKGTKGCLCSFSCTLSTIRKFRNALAKYNSTEAQTSLGDRAKGLDESELLSLTSIGEISEVKETRLASLDTENLFMKMIRNSTLPIMTERLLESLEIKNLWTIHK